MVEVMMPQQKVLLQGLESLQGQGLLCDVSLRADDVYVDVHRCVLAASSPYFRAMFTLETVESGQSSIQLHNVPGSVLADLVSYLYTGSVHLDEENVQALTTVAEMWQVSTLKDKCEQFMSSALCAENCLEVYNFADFIDMKELKANSETFILDNFLDVFRSDDFLKLRLQSITKILGSDRLNVQKEECVYESAMSWLRYDWEHRKKDLILLLLCIRFPLVTLEYIDTVIAKEHLIKDTSFGSHLVQRAREFKLSPISEAGEIQFCSKPRFGMCNKNMLVFSGGAHNATDRAFGCFDPETGQSYHTIKHHSTFDFKCKIDFYRLVVADNNQIYFLGGIFYDDYHFESNGGTARRTVLVYDQGKGVWAEVTPMREPRCAFGVCYSAGRIYVFGGYSRYPDHAPLEDVAMYDVATDEWARCDPLPVGIAHPATTVCGDKALLFGGKDSEHQYLDTVLEYGFVSDQWTLVDTQMPVPRAEGTAVTHEKTVFLLGGENRTGSVLSVLQFDISRRRWTFADDFPDDRKFTSITKGEDCIFVCGGSKQFISRSRSSRRSKTVESLDLFRFHFKDKSWTKVARYVDHGSNYACVWASVNVNFLEKGELQEVDVQPPGESEK